MHKSKKDYLLVIVLFIVAFLILLSRRPEILTHAQFWAEDGRVWYANAQNLSSFQTLFQTQDGYFQTLSRLAAIASLALPMERAPLLFNFVAIFVQLIPVLLLLTGRLNKLIPSQKIQVLIAFLYLALPNTAEVSGNLTNAQWYLALSACLVLFTDSAKGFWKWFDAGLVALSGLSGPFSIFLFPIAFLLWLKQRDVKTLKLGIIIFAAGIIQAMGLLFFSHGSRGHITPEVSIRLFFAILNRQVFMGTILGVKGYLWILAQNFHPVRIFSALGGLSIVMVVWALVKANIQVRLFVLFALLIFLASLFNPTVADHSIPAWEFLSRSVAGARYWLIPMLGFLVCLIFCLGKGNPMLIRTLAGLFLALMSIGIIVDWQYPKYVDYNFKDQVKAFQALPVGESLTFPINPPGWDMTLIR